jgi:hypothetical protein
LDALEKGYLTKLHICWLRIVVNFGCALVPAKERKAIKLVFLTLCSIL